MSHPGKQRGSLRSYTGDYRFNSLFFRNFRLIMLVLVVPILVLMGYAYASTRALQETEMKENNRSTAIRIRNDLDHIAEDNAQAVVSLALNPNVRAFSDKKELDKAYSGIQEIDAIQKVMASTLIARTTLEDVVIGFEQVDYLIAPDSSLSAPGTDAHRDIPDVLFHAALPGGTKMIFRQANGCLFVKSDITSFGRHLGTVIGKTGNALLLNRIRALLQSPLSMVLVLDREGNVLLESRVSGSPPSADWRRMALLASTAEDNRFEQIHNSPYVVSTLLSDSMGWRYVLATPLDDFQRRMRNTNLLMLELSLFSLLIALLVSWFMTFRIYRPIRIILDVLRSPSLSVADLPASEQKALDEVGFISNRIRNTQLQNVQYRTQLERESEMLRQTQSIALQAQINPHFLNNTLESINWKVLELSGGRQNDASVMINELSTLLKISLDARNLCVPVSEELAHARIYTSLQSRRFKNRFEVSWVVDESLLDCQTVKLSLQPVIENAIHHGLRHCAGEGRISIECHDIGERISFVVEDNGAGMSRERLEQLREKLNSLDLTGSAHMGLMNIHQRLRLVFGEGAGIHVDSVEGEGTKVILILPKVRFVPPTAG